MSLEQGIKFQNEKNYEEANKIFIQLSRQSNLQATFLYAQNLYNGFGVTKNRSEAYQIFDNILEINPSVKLIETYANLRFEDHDIFLPSVSEEERNEFLARTLNLFEFAVMYESKHPFIYFNLAVCYETGYGTPVDLNRAQENFELALKHATKGFGNTKMKINFHLGRIRLLNPNTFNLAFQNILYSANLGFKAAFIYAGRLYYEGKIVPKDDAKAFHFFSLAAKNGIIEGQFYLAEMYEKGIEKVVEKNLNKAIELYFAVGTALCGKNDVIIESLPEIASIPENCEPIDQRAIEKLRTYRPEVLNLLDSYKKCQSKDNECTVTFTHHNFFPQKCYICYELPSMVLNNCICTKCMKKCYNGCHLIDNGMITFYCDCLCTFKK